MHKLKGDTLIEVALAIGVFSMVAITVVSVTSASTSGAQSALETTITREELDAQAEALRFIHESYISGSQSKNTEENPYAGLWKTIIRDVGDEYIDNDPENPNLAMTYNPVTCSENYDTGKNSIKLNQDASGAPFIINIRNLNNPSNPDEIYISGKEDPNKSGVFFEPDTYPRIVYGDMGEDLKSQAESNDTTIKRVEGIYIIAFRGKSKLISGDGSQRAENRNTYYDFYIRSCWMPVGSDRASTISTVVRLYDPAVIDYNKK